MCVEGSVLRFPKNQNRLKIVIVVVVVDNFDDYNLDYCYLKSGVPYFGPLRMNDVKKKILTSYPKVTPK